MFNTNLLKSAGAQERIKGITLIRGIFRTHSNIYDGVAKIVNDFYPLTIFKKSSIVDVRLGSKYASVNSV